MNPASMADARDPSEPRWDLVRESLDEAAFLWRHRQRALAAPDRGLCDVAQLEERLLGCIDGLHVGGARAARELSLPALRSNDVARVSAAAYALAAEGSSFAWDCLLAELSVADDGRAEAVASGLSLVEHPELLRRLESAMDVGSPTVLASAVEIRAHHGLDAGEHARELMRMGHHRLQRAVVWAARHGTHADAGATHGLIELALTEPPRVRDAALESGIIIGHGAAAAHCSELITRLTDDCGEHLILAAASRPDEERRNLLAALDRERLAASAVRALGFAGTRWAADACLDLMRCDRYALPAREAFRAITGMPPEPAITGMPPEPASVLGAPSTPDDAAGVGQEPAALAPGEVRAIERWWSWRRASLDPTRRHVRGRPLNDTVLAEALLTEPMQRRPGIALQLAVLTRGQRQLETRGWCRRQRREAAFWLERDAASQCDRGGHAGAP